MTTSRARLASFFVVVAIQRSDCSGTAPRFWTVPPLIFASMTTTQIVQQRIADLRQFFIGRFGYGWQTQLRKRIGMQRQLPYWFTAPQTIKRFPSPWLERFESAAVKLGYKLGNLERPFETHERKPVQ